MGMYKARPTIEVKRIAIRECFGLPIDSFSARTVATKASRISVGSESTRASSFDGHSS